MIAAGTDDDIGRLFSARPADFVAERNAIVKKLKAAGRRGDAATIEKLPRPTLSVWAVNQIARQEPALVRQLADATAGLRGGNAGGGLRYADLLAAHREVLKELRRKAEELLDASGFRPAPELLTRVVHDLRAGISSPESRPLVESGRLVRDVAEDSETNPFAGAPEAAPASATQAETKARAGDRAHDRVHDRKDGTDAPAAQEQERARAREAAREQQAARAREEARAFRRRRLENLRERVATARAANERDERALEAASRALKEAERRSEVSRAALAEEVAALQAAEDDSES
jgi:hypothetical protein